MYLNISAIVVRRFIKENGIQINMLRNSTVNQTNQKKTEKSNKEEDSNKEEESNKVDFEESNKVQESNDTEEATKENIETASTESAKFLCEPCDSQAYPIEKSNKEKTRRRRSISLHKKRTIDLKDLSRFIQT